MPRAIWNGVVVAESDDTVVVDGDQLVGIITDSDFVGVAINLLEQLEETEPDSELETLEEVQA